MAAFVTLSPRDINVLGKIRDPEAVVPSGSALPIDSSLPRDPHVTDPSQYARISQQEKDIVLSLQQAEMELAGLRPRSLPDPLDSYRQSTSKLGALIAKHADYASARNNRAQALRRLHGDDMLLQRDEASQDRSQYLLQGTPDNADEQTQAEAAATVLSDLDRCIALLLPRAPDGSRNDIDDSRAASSSSSSSPSSPASSAPTLSPTAARTLSLAFTQRAAVYHATSKHMSPQRRILSQLSQRPESRWTQLDFEEAASRDFAMGGRFGNEIARGLAVGTNPTAKLCGQMVQQMMKSEYGVPS